MSLRPPTEGTPSTASFESRMENNIGTVSLRGLGADHTGAVAADSYFTRALADGRPIDLGGTENTFKLSAPVTGLSSGTRIVGNGATVDMSAVAADVDGFRRAFDFRGTVGTSTLLTANGVKSQRQVTVTSVSGFAAGDWVRVGSVGDFYPASGTNPDADRGEIKRIRSISTLTVVFEQELYDNYPTASAAFMQKLDMVEDVEVRGVNFVGDTDVATQEERAIDLYLVNGFRVTDCDFADTDSRNVSVMSSIRGSIYGNRFSGTDAGDALEEFGTFYGVGIYDASQWIKVFGNDCQRQRRLGVTSCHSEGQDWFGQPRFVEVYGNTCTHIYREMWEQHGFGEHIQIYGNSCDGCDGIVRIEGPGQISVTDNQVRNWRDMAIQVDSDCVIAENITIADNKIYARSLEGGTGGANSRAIMIDCTNATTIRNIFVENNKIYDWDKLDRAAIDIDGTGTAENCWASGNRITCTGTHTTYVIDVDVPGWRIMGGSITGAKFGVRLNGDAQEVIGGDYQSSDSVSGHAVQMNGTNQRVVGVTGRQAFAALNITSNATNWTAENNVFKVPSSARAIVNGSNIAGRALNNSWELASGNFSVASAASMTLSPMGSMYWQMTGTTTVNYINSMTEGTEITIEAAAASTLAHNVASAPAGFSKMLLNGGANLVLSADDVVKLVFRGGVWRQAAAVSAN